MNREMIKKITGAAVAAFLAITAAGGVVRNGSYREVSIERGAQTDLTSPQEQYDAPKAAQTGGGEPKATESAPDGGKDAASYIDSGSDQIRGRIDLNRADASELESLKGIGPAKAKAIIEYRDAHGGFVCAEEITEVKGIGQGIYSKIKDDIYVSSE